MRFQGPLWILERLITSTCGRAMSDSCSESSISALKDLLLLALDFFFLSSSSSRGSIGMPLMYPPWLGSLLTGQLLFTSSLSLQDSSQLMQLSYCLTLKVFFLINSITFLDGYLTTGVSSRGRKKSTSLADPWPPVPALAQVSGTTSSSIYT